MPPARTKQSKNRPGQENPNALPPASAQSDMLRKLEQVSKLQKAGRLKDAFEICREIYKADPENVDAHNLGGVIAFQGGNKALAEKLLRRAVTLAPEHAGALNNLGIVFKETGQFDQAIEAFNHSLKLNASDADTHFNLGNTYNMSGDRERAADAFQRALALRPKFLDAAYNRAMMLSRSGLFADAAEAFRRVIDLKPDFEEARFELAKALVKSGQDEAAKEIFTEVERDTTPTNETFYRTCVATMHTRGPHALRDRCDARLDERPGDPLALSTKVIAHYAIEDKETGRALADFDRFVRPFRLSTPDGFSDMAEFNAALVEHVRHHPTLEFEPQTQATRLGRHTGNLNQDPKGPIAHFECAIVGACKNYVASMKVEPQHPFLDIIPERSHQIIWSIIMNTQGHQVPHIHPQAWLSGVYYPKLPSLMDAEDENHAGWIEFGEPPEDLACDNAPEVKVFKPEEGLLFLFPSFFYHRTIPFDSEEERVSVAFDFIAEDEAQES